MFGQWTSSCEMCESAAGYPYVHSIVHNATCFFAMHTDSYEIYRIQLLMPFLFTINFSQSNLC